MELQTASIADMNLCQVNQKLKNNIWPILQRLKQKEMPILN